MKMKLIIVAREMMFIHNYRYMILMFIKKFFRLYQVSRSGALVSIKTN